MSGLLWKFLDGVYRPSLIEFPTLTLADSSKMALLKDVSMDFTRALEENQNQMVVKYANSFPSLPTLAGLLLSYPALYYSEDSSAKLTDAEVDVHSIYSDSPNRQTLIQFSASAAFRQDVADDLEILAADWNRKASRLAPSLAEKWKEYTGVESCTLKTRVETRRVSMLTL